MEFTLKTTLDAPANDIYNAWLNSEGHTAMTGGKATASNKVRGAFTAWDGYLNGKNLLLEENKRIVQSWRSSQFEPHEEDSQIEVILKEQVGGTELTLTHTKVPDSGEHYKKGWDEHYFQPMKKYFSKK
ncbi:MAG: activator of HSP90 ATPase [Psychroserpens sp.]